MYSWAHHPSMKHLPHRQSVLTIIGMRNLITVTSHYCFTSALDKCLCMIFMHDFFWVINPNLTSEYHCLCFSSHTQKSYYFISLLAVRQRAGLLPSQHVVALVRNHITTWVKLCFFDFNMSCMVSKSLLLHYKSTLIFHDPCGSMVIHIQSPHGLIHSWPLCSLGAGAKY